MKILDKVKTWVKAVPSKVMSFLRRVKAFLIRHAMMLIFIVGTSGWVFFFPKMNPDNNPQLFLLLVVAFLLGTMRDHEVWHRQRVKLEAELKLLQKTKKK